MFRWSLVAPPDDGGGAPSTSTFPWSGRCPDIAVENRPRRRERLAVPIDCGDGLRSLSGAVSAHGRCRCPVRVHPCPARRPTIAAPASPQEPPLISAPFGHTVSLADGLAVRRPVQLFGKAAPRKRGLHRLFSLHRASSSHSGRNEVRDDARRRRGRFRTAGVAAIPAVVRMSPYGSRIAARAARVSRVGPWFVPVPCETARGQTRRGAWLRRLLGHRAALRDRLGVDRQTPPAFAAQALRVRKRSRCCSARRRGRGSSACSLPPFDWASGWSRDRRT